MTTAPNLIGAKTDVSICLTPFAPGCEAEAIGAKARWITLWSAPLGRVALELCKRLDRAPDALFARRAELDVEICGRVEGQDAPVPLALIAYGASADDINTGLEALRARRRAA